MEVLRLPIHASPVTYLFRFRRPRYPPRFVSRLRSAPGRMEVASRAWVIGQPETQFPACSHVDMSGISQVSRRPVLCLCPGQRPRPNRQSLANGRSCRCCPRLCDSEGFSVKAISRLPRGLSTCCLRFKNGVATIPARLASGWLARLYREGVEPSGSR